MIYRIFNESLSVSVDSMGAQLRSLRSADGTEYLWQGDEYYWADSSPLLFPYIARLYKNSYTYCGKAYSMGIHGFAAQCSFEAEAVSDDSITLSLCQSEYTLKQYPFCFRLSITYSLSGTELLVRYHIINTDKIPMFFALGGHPGFNVPMCAGTEFEDYYLCFGERCNPLRIGFTDELLLSGENIQYPLEGGRIIRLHHSIFDKDAIVLKNTSTSVSLGCRKTKKKLTMGFSGFEYFGIWHAPGTDAAYVCLEPWTSLPSRQGVVEEFTEKEDLLRLDPEEQYEAKWSVVISEDK